jgi:predicted acylesterase/phospholipase RssA
MHELDVYVGVSSGAFLTASLANGMSTAQLCRIFLSSPDAEFSFSPEQFLRPAMGEFLKRAKSIPSVVLDMLSESIRHPQRILKLESMEGVARLIPTGIFDNHSIERFLAKVLSQAGRSNDFRELSTRLRIVAVDLDTGQAVRFGEPGLDDVPISMAVQASAALPGLYPPVAIGDRHFVDGALRRTLHASVALREGVDLLIGINPLVPYDAERPNAPSRMIRGGLPLVLSQTFRSLIQSRMQIGITKYAADFPHAGMMLIEPNRNDERMFFTNVFSYGSRTELVEHAYQTTRQELLARAEQLDAFLEDYGLSLNTEALQRPQTFADSLTGEPSSLSAVGQQLTRSLEQLDRLLGR